MRRLQPKWIDENGTTTRLQQIASVAKQIASVAKSCPPAAKPIPASACSKGKPGWFACQLQFLLLGCYMRTACGMRPAPDALSGLLKEGVWGVGWGVCGASWYSRRASTKD
jgi:hypothetical protein